MIILVTGSAGFIGFHLSKSLLEQGHKVIGIDNFNDYYEVSLKKSRNKILSKSNQYILYKGNLQDENLLNKIFKQHKIDVVVNLAAQAGVRYSVTNPLTYEESNSLGFLQLLESMRKHNVNSLVFASSSSVYGGIKETPFSESMKIDKPVSLYAATKAANELYAHSYNHLYGIKSIGLRFFTVYGPYGRPDMALYGFVKSIIEGKKIQVYNHGNQKRDFTYIDDIISGIISSINAVKNGIAHYEIVNLGRGKPATLMEFIKEIELALGKEAKKEFLPAQPGDVSQTHADISKAKKLLNYSPKTNIKEGIKNFVDWYLNYYK
jgi:UDP-glucuronate 4-epimerase